VAFNPRYGAMGLLSYPLVVLWAPSAINWSAWFGILWILAHFGASSMGLHSWIYCSSVSVFCIIFYTVTRRINLIINTRKKELVFIYCWSFFFLSH
jgi:hypothetical protein